MRAYEQSVTIADDEIAIRPPSDFPSGTAVRPLNPHPVLGKIVFYEDPALPLDPGATF